MCILEHWFQQPFNQSGTAYKLSKMQFMFVVLFVWSSVEPFWHNTGQQTDKQLQDDSIYRASMASRYKNMNKHAADAIMSRRSLRVDMTLQLHNRSVIWQYFLCA